ncbi:hypothetical protein C8R46DRAFT_1034445 [Mycena filopes]|nr:hypothetical protein C8R46DRAFT_1034445 [Mycena filopes]
MARILFAVLSSLFILQSLTAPLPRSTFSCSVNGTAVARVIGGDVLLVQRLVEELNVTTLADSTPLPSVQSSLADAKTPADAIGNVLLFPTLPQPPSDATAVILSSLQDAMTTFATVFSWGTRVDELSYSQTINKAGTKKLAETRKFLTKAISDAQMLNSECTSA